MTKVLKSTFLLPALLIAACGDDPATTPQPDPVSITTQSLSAGTVDTPYAATISAKDGAEGDYTWSVSAGALPEGIQLALNGRPSTTLMGTPSTEGTFTFTVEVKDSAGTTATQEYTVAIQPKVEVRPLEITSENPAPAQINEPYEATLTAADGSGSGYQWLVTEGDLPRGLTLGANGTPSTRISGTPTEAGDFAITVRVTDSEGNRSERGYTLVVVDPRLPLEIITTTLPDAIVDQSYSTTIEARNGTGTDYTWTIVAGSLPEGLTLTGGTPNATIDGTPTRTGPSSFKIRVTDSDGTSVEELLSLVVLNPPPRPSVETRDLPDAMEGSAYTATLNGVSGAPPYTWSIAAGSLPAGLTLDANGSPSTTISGTPSVSGDFTFTVRITDSNNLSGDRLLSLSIAPLVQPVSIVTPSQTNTATAAEAYSLEITAAGGLPPYNWVVTAGQLPPGLTLPVSGTPSTTLNGSPSVPGTYTATVSVFDMQNETASIWLNFTIIQPQVPLTIITPTLPDAGNGFPYSATLTAQDGSGADYTWSVVAGQLPPGLTLAPAGTPSTTLTGVSDVNGTYNFTVQVMDGLGNTATMAYTVVVSQPIQVDSWVIPNADLNTAYLVNLEAVGGTETGYVWSLDSGTLPAGVALDPAGQLNGTPTAAGSYSFVLRVADSNSDVATRRVTLKVRPAQTWVALVGDVFADNDTEFGIVNISGGAPAPAVRLNPPLPGIGDGTTTTDRWQFGPDGRTIAYTGDFLDDGFIELFISNIETSSPTQGVRLNATLTTGGDIQDFFYSPDGQKIAYLADQETDNVYELYVVDISGPTPGMAMKVNATVPVGDVQLNDVFWSPDSTKLAFQASMTASSLYELFVVDVSGPAPGLQYQVNLTLPSPSADVDDKIVWAPDSSRLYFRADMDTYNQDELYYADLVAGVPQLPVKINGPMVSAGDIGFDDWDLSPNGQKIFYVADQETDLMDELYVVDLTRPIPAPVKINGPLATTSNDVYIAEWSPDSTRIAYVADQEVSSDDELYVVDVSTSIPSVPVKISPPFAAGTGVDTSALYAVTWSPNSDGIAFRGDLGTSSLFELWYVSLAGTVPGTPVLIGPPVSGTSDVNSYYGWSEDGTKLWLTADPTLASTDELFVVFLTAGVPAPAVQISGTPITGSDVTGSSTTRPWFSRDGSRIYYRADTAVDNDFEGWVVDLSGPSPTAPVRVSPVLPTNGDLTNLRIQE